ncbi:lipocalin family protein [Agarivorans sp. 1_MG-2023]|uniref:lipocalin family protein n=1 Tax=Agarivorans sp. 1_MG-2023 TaxID=3062634 RepID=UPI0026E2C876|nr:lipocalin family protein [Agarivorans sp. 1_MG-2023]MDO6763020.1 lipocalin family protein [Agarivorans sp. 1_MG-2023]
MKKTVIFVAVLLISACSGKPEGIEPVSNFQLQKYLGTWYEVARLDHSFERGMSHVTATYSLRDDGKVTVLNKGFSEQEQQWFEAEGIAQFVDSPDIGHLKVSFFRPFYGAYVVFALDEQDYQYALVAGPNRKYLWLLARTPDLAHQVKRDLVHEAKDLGYDVDALIYVDHHSEVITSQE